MVNEMPYAACEALFARNHLKLAQNAYEKLDQYANLLISESAHQNVTAVRALPDIWVRHFLDSAYLAEIVKEGNVLDLGTGGGIPAIPLAILNPELRITMLDSELRKIEFCQHAVNEIGLTAKTVCGRAEEIARASEYEAQFDCVVSRAMANGSVLTELAVRFLKAGGCLIAMKGRQYDPSVERFAEAASALGCCVEQETEYALEGEMKHLITVRKLSDTPLQYPRRYAKIKRSPL
ncbi:MAG: 16S rRNA (guanine(527)-N(7))-methyltransferase RsmG [Oscillospiraceae bacterium]|nr:16S rRNA (guanine(527)-N(7))-methyltransferase RsmG [Oscillospiraceae bacterium]